MGCLSMHIERIGGDLHMAAERIGGDLNMTAERIGGDLHMTAERIGGLQMNVYFVCDVGREEYIKVTPEEPMWIVVGEDLTYRIRSNTGWIIE